MELQQALEKRKSTRHYLPKEVESEKIREIIEAAILSPSWKNSQVTRYYVATGNGLKKVYDALPEFNRKIQKTHPF